MSLKSKTGPMQVQKAFTTAPLFYLLSTIWILVLSALLLTYEKADLHLLLNSFHTPLLDLLFRLLTFLGDGWFVLMASLVLLFNNFRRAIMLGLSGIISGLITQLLKRQVFPDAYRPIKWFGDSDLLPLVEHVHMAALYSFPSGHATAAFAVATCLALFFQRPVYQICIFMLAALAAFSRVYLSLHFASDILAGSIIGITVATLICVLLSNAKAPWLQRALFKGRVEVT